MPLSREDVVAGYRFLLGREPESEAVIAEHIAAHGDLAAFRAALSGTEEYARASRGFLRTLADGYQRPTGRVKLKTDLMPDLFARIQDQWVALGRDDPYWSVITDNRYRADSITPRLREHFFGSGKLGADLIRIFETATGARLARGTCLELGCGVGRITRYLAPLFEHVVAVDISPGNLAIAEQTLAEAGIDNVEYRLVQSLDGFAALPAYDTLFSMIVLQHNPPPIQAVLLDLLFGKMRPGGGCLFQTVTDLPDYSFDPVSYLASPPPVMEIHALPQAAILRLMREHRIEIQAIRMDPWLDAYGSNTFMGIRDL